MVCLVPWPKRCVLFDRLQHMGEGRDQMSFVEHHQSIGPKEPRMVRPHFRRNAVPGEHQARADHIDGANDNRRRGRIGQPLAIVHELAPQRRDRQRPTTQT